MTLSGKEQQRLEEMLYTVLIPLLVDDPLWVCALIMNDGSFEVLIPLLVDDPLWV